MNDERDCCATCTFSVTGNEQLFCHRFPPIIGWPEVRPSFWCGEHQPREDAKDSGT